MDNRDIRMESRHDDHILAAKWIRDALYVGVCFLQIRGACLLHWQEGQSGCPRLQTSDHAEVRILLPFEFALFDGRTDNPQRPHPGIAHVRKNHLAGAARRNHLIIDQIGCGTGEREVSLSLSDDFMPGRKRNQMCESCRVNYITIVHTGCNGF
jgi:hypothetical protein